MWARKEIITSTLIVVIIFLNMPKKKHVEGPHCLKVAIWNFQCFVIPGRDKKVNRYLHVDYYSVH